MVEVSHAPDHAAVARHARRQGGRVTLAQLKTAGRGRGAIHHDVEEGRLHHEHRGVYAVGHDASPRWAAENAAILAAGDDAVITFRSALEIWGALPPQPGRPVDVTVRTPRANRDGITVHRTRRLDPQDCTRRYDLPVTRPERSLLDAAEQLDDRELEVALNELLAKGLTTTKRIAALLDRSPGRRGVKRLRALLDPDDGYTRNDAERLLRRLMPHTGLRRVRYNAPIGRYKVDAYVPSHNLAIEVDGFNPHNTPKNFADDLERQNDLKVNYGVELLRFAYRTLRDHPERVIADVARATPSPGTTRA